MWIVGMSPRLTASYAVFRPMPRRLAASVTVIVRACLCFSIVMDKVGTGRDGERRPATGYEVREWFRKLKLQQPPFFPREVAREIKLPRLIVILERSGNYRCRNASTHSNLLCSLQTKVNYERYTFGRVHRLYLWRGQCHRNDGGALFSGRNSSSGVIWIRSESVDLIICRRYPFRTVQYRPVVYSWEDECEAERPREWSLQSA